jgi:glycosyltransferase involved in cell wall biosynthesis
MGNWFLWLLDKQHYNAEHVVTFRASPSEDDRFDYEVNNSGLSEAVLISARQELVFDLLNTDSKSDVYEATIDDWYKKECKSYSFTLPEDDDKDLSAGTTAYSLLRNLRSKLVDIVRPDGITQFCNWRFSGGWYPRSKTTKYIDSKVLDFPSYYPVTADEGKKDIGFIVPVFEFGGVEHVTMHVARVLRQEGHRTHLCIANQATLKAIERLDGAFDSVAFFDEEDIGHYSLHRPGYWEATTTWIANADKDNVVGLLSTMDVVVNCQSADSNAVMGQLRNLGIKTVAYLHLLEKTNIDDFDGFPYQVVNYEYSYDKVVAISDELMSWLHGMGIPEQKLIKISNAPSIDISEEERHILIQEKKSRQSDQMNVLYIGRLDYQKGVDRLIKIIEQTYSDPAINWRIVGSNTLDNENYDYPSEIQYLPATYSRDKYIKHLKWADVLVMPSRYEGVPLIIMDAMKLGVVPIFSDVGQINELFGEEGLYEWLQCEEWKAACFENKINKLVIKENRSNVINLLHKGAKEIEGKLSILKLIGNK